MRIGVVGTGSMGINHIRIYSEGGDLAGITDLNVELGKTISKKYNTEFYENIDSLLGSVDAISVSTPTSTHYDVVKKALDRGIDVLVEKPFTGDLNKAQSLCDIADRQNLVIAVGMVERYNPVVSTIKKRLSKGEFGELITFNSKRVSSMPDRIRDVGVIMDLGIHDVDVFSYLTSSQVKSIYCVGGGFNDTGFEDHANIMIETEEGINGMIEVNWLTPMKVRSVSLTCSKSFIELDYMEQSITTSSSRFSAKENDSPFESPWEFDRHKVSLKKEEPLKRELNEFIDCIKNRRRPLVDGWDALNDLRICSAAIQSMKENKPVYFI